jgi:hypothetical protein
VVARLQVLVPVSQAAAVAVHVMLRVAQAHGLVVQPHNLANQQQPMELRKAVTVLDSLVVQAKIPQAMDQEVAAQVEQVLHIVKTV